MRKQSFRKKRSFRRRRVYRNKKGQNIHLFKRLYSESSVTVTAASDEIRTYQVNLAELPGFNEFTALYRQYKINGLKITVIPKYQNPMVDGGTIFGGLTGRLYVARSYDEVYTRTGGAGNTLDEVRQLQGCKLKNGNRMWSYYCPKPCFASVISTDQDSVATTSTRPARGWLDTEQSAYNHLGIVVGWESAGTTTNEYRIEAQAYLSFKGYK